MLMAWLYNARIIAIFAVVLLHVSGDVVVVNTIGSDDWWVGNIYDSLVRWCLPVFVMMSGALLLDPEKKESMLTFYRKRLSRVLVPLIFWSVFFLYRRHLGGEKLPGMEILNILLAGTPHGFMWFLYMILGLYLFTPFFRKVVALSTRGELALLVASGFVLAAASYAHGAFVSGSSRLFFERSVLYVPYFFIGHLIREDENPPPRAVAWIVFIISWVLTAWFTYSLSAQKGLAAGLYFYSFLSITVIPMSISFMYILKTWSRPIINMNAAKKLSGLTLGIYLIHSLVWDVTNNMGYDAHWFDPIGAIPARTLLIYAVSLVIAWVVSRVPHLKRII